MPQDYPRFADVRDERLRVCFAFMMALSIVVGNLHLSCAIYPKLT